MSITITEVGETIAEEIPLIPEAGPSDLGEEFAAMDAAMTDEEREFCKPKGEPCSDEELAKRLQQPFDEDFYSEGNEIVIVQGEDGVFHKAEEKPHSDPEDATDPERPTPFDTPDALAAYDAETVRLVNEEAEEVAHFERAYDEANDVAKECKKAFEKSQAALRELIEDRRKGRGKPKQPTLYADPQPEPLGEDGEDDSEIEASDENAEATVDATPNPDASGVWQGNHEFTPAELAMPLSSLSLPQGIINKLADPTAKDGGAIRPITTVGEYFAYLQPSPNGFQPYLKNIKGLGDTAVEKIEQAIFDFTAECCARKQREQGRAA